MTQPTPNLDNFLAVYSEVMMRVALRKEGAKDALVANTTFREGWQDQRCQEQQT
jgi:hypothetical protein